MPSRVHEALREEKKVRFNYLKRKLEVQRYWLHKPG